MQKKTRSILEELESMYLERDLKQVIENRGLNIISSAIQLLDTLDGVYSAEEIENITRKFLCAIKIKDPRKFSRALRKTDANTRSNNGQITES